MPLAAKLRGRGAKPRLGVRINPAAAARLGVVGLWLANEGAGNTLYDATGRGNNGTLTGGAAWSPEGVTFDGANDIASATLSIPASPITLMARCRINNTASEQRIIQIADPATSVRYVELTTPLARGWEYQIRNGGTFDSTNFAAASGGTIDGGWHTIAGVSESSSLHRIYADGRILDTDTNASTPTGLAALGIGGERDSAAAFGAVTIEWAMVCNRALTASEIAALSTPTGLYDALVLPPPLWRGNLFAMSAQSGSIPGAVARPVRRTRNRALLRM